VATTAIVTVLVALPCPADAAVITGLGETATYIALPFEANHVVVTRDGHGVVIEDSDGSLTVSGLGCEPIAPRRVRCVAAKSVALQLGDGDDSADIRGHVISKVDGGPGRDILRGGLESDRFDGGDGSDVLEGGDGGDVLDGGAGRDTVDYSDRVRSVFVTLDGDANDGEAGEGDNVISVERVLGGAGDDVLVGGPGDDVLDGGPGEDSLAGLDGTDEFAGGPGADGMNALDPAPRADRVDCGNGEDRVFADGADGVAGDCESVDRQGVLGYRAHVAAGPAAPELGSTVVLAPVSGLVLVSPPPPGSAINSPRAVPAAAPVPLDEPRNVPLGTVVDTRRGRVALRIAIDRQGTIQQGQFFSGTFQVRQGSAPGSPADLLLRGGKSFHACPAGQRGRVARTSKKRRRRGSAVRSLWGSGTGRFRTHGRLASATVRGTEWLTEDRCDGTLIRVAKGAVVVRNRLTGKLVLVRAGHQYLARAGRRPGGSRG
jgi:Ca2+-binding RTX toxin-like protein